MKSICFLIDSLNRGGIAVSTILIANELKKNGYSISIATFASTNLREAPPDINLHKIDSFGWFSSLIKLRKYFKDQKHSCIIVPNIAPSAIAALACLLLRKHDRPQIFCVIHLDYLSKLSQRKIYSKDSVIDIVSSAILRFLNVPTAGVSYSCGHRAHKALPLLPNRISTVGNPYRISPEILPLHSFLEHLEWWEKGNGKLLMINRLDKLKQTILAVKAIKLMPITLRPCLIIIGDGPEYDSISHFIKSNCLESHVRMLGFLENPSSFLAYADFFVMTSRQEALPLTLLDSLAAGTPIITTICSDAAFEILQCNYSIGEIIHKETPREVANVITSCLQNRHRFKKEEILKRAEYFSPEQTMIRYLDFINTHSPPQ